MRSTKTTIHESEVLNCWYCGNRFNTGRIMIDSAVCEIDCPECGQLLKTIRKERKTC